MLTSDPNIYAVGDVTECIHFVTNQPSLIPLAGPANRQGRLAANNISGYPEQYDKTQGTAICKVLELTAACTGANEKLLKLNNLKYEKIYIHPMDHSEYYPAAKLFTMKFIFQPSDGKILGAQAVGHTNVDKRIDVIAVAMRAGLSIYNLAELELCYAPPFGSAKDPVNYAGFIARNIKTNLYAQCHYADIINPSPDQIVLDVRTLQEYQSGIIPNARHIPVNDLRMRMPELPKDKEILIYCWVGVRGYIAARILMQSGYQCRNLSGGIRTYRDCEAIES